MTENELLESCAAWDGSEEEFANIVSAAVDRVGTTQRELAEEFEVGESTVSRWAHAVARPHPRMQRLVVAYVLGATLARTSGYLPPMPVAASRKTV